MFFLLHKFTASLLASLTGVIWFSHLFVWFIPPLSECFLLGYYDYYLSFCPILLSECKNRVAKRLQLIWPKKELNFNQKLSDILYFCKHFESVTKEKKIFSNLSSFIQQNHNLYLRNRMSLRDNLPLPSPHSFSTLNFYHSIMLSHLFFGSNLAG